MSEGEEGTREGVLGGFGGVRRYGFLRGGMLGAFSAGLGDRRLRSYLGSSDGHYERDELGILSAKRRLRAGCACTYTQSQCPFFLSLTLTAIPNNRPPAQTENNLKKIPPHLMTCHSRVCQPPVPVLLFLAHLTHPPSLLSPNSLLLPPPYTPNNQPHPFPSQIEESHSFLYPDTSFSQPLSRLRWYWGWLCLLVQ